MVIGLSLATEGVKMATESWPLALTALITAIVAVTYARGMIKLIPIFCGIIAGYLAAIVTGHVDFSLITNAPWFALPEFTTPKFSWAAIIYMIPVAIAPLIEHIGDMYAIGAVAGKNYVKDPGLHRTMLGDGVATALAGSVGSIPNTTYSEVTGAVSLTKITDPMIMRISGITAIAFSVLGKITGFLESIPSAVLGGIMLLLFGMIASVGIKTLIDSKTNINKTRNQVIISIILTVGIGGAVIEFGNFSLAGIGLAAVTGVILNLILPNHSKPVKMKK
jgi:uracil permease